MLNKTAYYNRKNIPVITHIIWCRENKFITYLINIEKAKLPNKEPKNFKNQAVYPRV